MGTEHIRLRGLKGNYFTKETELGLVFVIRCIFSRCIGSGQSFPVFSRSASNLFWLEHRGRCRAGTGLEQSMEGVSFQPEQFDEIREGGGGDKGKDMSCILVNLEGTVLFSGHISVSDDVEKK